MSKSWKRTATRTALIVTLVLSPPFLLGYSWLKCAYVRGEFAAYTDVRHGKYIELGDGFPTPRRLDGVRLLHTRYADADFVPVAGCIVSSALMGYVSGYNHYSEQAAIKHFGRNIFEEALDDAFASWKRMHPETRSTQGR